MGCNCGSKNRAMASGGRAATVNGTYRVMVGDRQVYETTNADAAETVGDRFNDALIMTPDGKTLKNVSGSSGRSWAEQ